MSNLTIRMAPQDKERLTAWAAMRGKTTTDYIKGLIAADMATGTASQRAAAWHAENATALETEADYIRENGVPGASLALNYPAQDEDV